MNVRKSMALISRQRSIGGGSRGRHGVHARRIDTWTKTAIDGFSALFVKGKGAAAGTVSALPVPHRDPFDRRLAGRAIAEGHAFLPADAAFDILNAPRVWP